MILSDKTIEDYLKNGKIQVLPEFKCSDIRPVGIRLHLGEDILVPVEEQTVDLDSDQDIKFERINLLKNSYILKPGHFVLGSTFEKFRVSRDIVCHIEGRSTIARLGLAIHCTSGIIDGNFEEARTIVLEIKNQGPFNLVLNYKTALAMLSFTQLTSEIKQATQKQYKGQDGVVAPNLCLQKA